MTNRLKPAETYTHTHTHTCNLLLSPKQIGTICFAISILISAPLFATDIPSSASTADCKHTPLQVYSGTSNLEAGWTANTIQLHWYNGDTEIQNVPVASQSCVYDDSLTPPSTIPTRTGYTFKGWRVRQPAQCSLSNLVIDGEVEVGELTYVASRSSTNSCVYFDVREGEIESNCDNSYVSGLNSGEWIAAFSHGIAYGESKCSAKTGNNRDSNNGRWKWVAPSSDWIATESELTLAGNGENCWCKATKYTPSGGTQCNITPSVWVFADNVYDCAEGCANYCSMHDRAPARFYRAMFTGQP